MSYDLEIHFTDFKILWKWLKILEKTISKMKPRVDSTSYV